MSSQSFRGTVDADRMLGVCGPMTKTRLALLVLLLPLAACDSGTNYARTFGIARDAPDEFRVTTRAPLSMPPDFALHPPQPGATRPQEMTQRDQAAATLVPDTALSGDNGAMSAGQQALLQQAGPPAPANIRNQVDSTPDPSSERSLTDRLMFWKSPPTPGTVVDASKETQRLRANAALGQSPEIGDTPIIQPKSSGFLGSIF
jgi:Protein of unknown function (DUF3035)